MKVIFDEKHSTVQPRILKRRARASISSGIAPQADADQPQSASDFQPNNDELERKIQMQASELRDAKIAHEKCREELQNFLYFAAHDLRAPLRAAKVFSGFLVSEYGEKLDSTAHDYINTIGQSTKRMDALVEGLTTLSSEATREQKLGSVNLGDVVHQALMKLRRTIAGSDAVVEVDALPDVFGDAKQLSLLLAALIDNGIKFNDSTANIHISATESGGECVIAIQDNGIGIADKYCTTVFDLYRRLHLQNAYEGIGVGLTLSKVIAERHGGRIWLDSIEGFGTTVYVALKADDSGE